MYILPWMLIDYGYTDDCPGCSAKKVGVSISKPHSANCRKRVEEKIGEDPREQKAKDRADEKWKQWAAREAEKDDNDDQKDDNGEKAEPKTSEAEARAFATDEEGEADHGDAAEIPVPQGDQGEDYDLDQNMADSFPRASTGYGAGEAVSSSDKPRGKSEANTGLGKRKEESQTVVRRSGRCKSRERRGREPKRRARRKRSDGWRRRKS